MVRRAPAYPEPFQEVLAFGFLSLAEDRVVSLRRQVEQDRLAAFAASAPRGGSPSAPGAIAGLVARADALVRELTARCARVIVLGPRQDARSSR